MNMPRPWYAEPMLWLVIAIPLLTVLAGITTVAIASVSGSSDAVIDPVRRTAQVQDRALAGDRMAAHLKLAAVGTIDAATGALQLTLEAAPSADERLALTFAHPVRASQDRSVILVPDGVRGWLGRAEIDAGHDWNLVLTPAGESWRLVGRFRAGQTRFELQPALRQP